jgi:hypothetical protein
LAKPPEGVVITAEEYLDQFNLLLLRWSNVAGFDHDGVDEEPKPAGE